MSGEYIDYYYSNYGKSDSDTSESCAFEIDENISESTSESDVSVIDTTDSTKGLSCKFLESLQSIIVSSINEEVMKFSDFEVLTKDEVNRIYKNKKIKKYETENVDLKTRLDKMKKILSKINDTESDIDEIKDMIHMRKENNKLKLKKVPKLLTSDYLPSNNGSYDQRVQDFLLTYKDRINNTDPVLDKYNKKLKKYKVDLQYLNHKYENKKYNYEYRKDILMESINKEIESFDDKFYYIQSGQFALDKHEEKLNKMKEELETVKNTIENYDILTFTVDDIEKFVKMYNDNNKSDSIEIGDLIKPIDTVIYKGNTYEVYSFDLENTEYVDEIFAKNTEGENVHYRSKYLKLLVAEENKPIDTVQYKGKTYELYKKEVEGAELVARRKIKKDNKTKEYFNKYWLLK